MIMLYFLGLFVVVASLTIGAQFLFHRFGGWKKLELSYPGPKTAVKGKKIGMSSFNIGNMGYQNSVKITLNEEGIYIKPYFMLVWHKALFIPWAAIETVEEKRFIRGSYYKVTIEGFLAKISFSEAIIRWGKEAAKL